MRRFKFRLQTSLKVAELREDLLRQELQQRMTACKQARDQLNRLVAQHRLLEAELREVCRVRPQIETICLFRNYLAVVHGSVRRQQSRLAELEAELDQCRSRLHKIMLERRLLEKLKSRCWQQYRQQVLAAEQKQIDEMAIRLYQGIPSQ